MINHTFVNNELLFLLIFPLIILIWYILKNKNINSNILFSDTGLISNRTTLKNRLRHLPYLLKIIASVLMIFAIARPQSSSNWDGEHPFWSTLSPKGVFGHKSGLLPFALSPKPSPSESNHCVSSLGNLSGLFPF